MTSTAPLTSRARPIRRLGAATLAAGSLAVLLAPGADAAARPPAATIATSVPTGATTAPTPAPSTSATSTPATTPSTPVTPETAAQLLLTGVTPAAVTPDTPLTVTGTVRNAGTTPLPGLRVTLRLNPSRLRDRDAVRAWTTRGIVRNEHRRLPGAAPIGTLAPGATANFTIRVPAGDLDLPGGGEAFGPRGVGVEATTGAERTRAGLTRTTLVWYPIKEFQPTRLSLVAPITAPAGTSPTDPSGDLAAAFAPGGALGRTLAAAGTDPLIGWALDPALLDAARTLADGEEDETPGADPTATPSPTASASPAPSATVSPEQREAAGAWLDSLVAGREGRDVVTLPYGDPDLVAVTRGEAGSMLRLADRLARTATDEAFGEPLAPQIAWPAGGAVDAPTLAALEATGRSGIILGSATQPVADPGDSGDTTATGRSTVLAGGGRLDGLLYDEQLSSLFGQAGGARGAAATQQLVSELAAITLELPGRSRHVLAVVPRGWQPDPQRVQAAMTALRTTPWIALRTLSQLRETAPPAGRGQPVYPESALGAELPIGHVTTMAGIYRDVDGFGSALVDPGPVVDPIVEQCLMLLSAAWRRDRQGLGAARGPVADEVEGLTDGVRILRGTPRPFFLASEASLPVSVTNRTPYPVRVVVTLKAKSGQVRFENSEVSLDPRTNRQQVLVPTQALASGDVPITASLTTPGGDQVGDEVELVIRVRREWEQRGLIGVGSVLAVLLAFGLLRGVRKDRTRVRPEDVPDVDDLASAAGDRAAARRDAIEEAAREDGEGGPPPGGLTERDPAAGSDDSDQEPGTGHAVASPDSEAGGPGANRPDGALDRPVTSREPR